MRIGLDALPLTSPKTGVGHYTWEVAVELARLQAATQFELVYPTSSPPVTLAEGAMLPPNLKIDRVSVGPLGRHWWSVGLPRYIRRRGIDLFHGTNYGVPLRRRCATVLTIHDLSPLLHPTTHTRRSVNHARRRLPTMARTADAIITPTESVRREVCEHLSVAPQKVFAVPEAARECFRAQEFVETENVRRRLGIADEFLLAVGTIEPRKNLKVLISAFEQFMAAHRDNALQLVIAGGAGWLSGPLLDSIKESPARECILLTDYLKDDDLRALYSSCRAFIYPSMYEGFGLPPLEAMACGAPVIVSRAAALMETTGDAAWKFDSNNPAELADKIQDLISNENTRRELSLAGQHRAAEYSWRKTAELTWNVYQEALRCFRG